MERRAVSTVDEGEEGRESSIDEPIDHIVETNYGGESEGESLLPFPRTQQFSGEYGTLESPARSMKSKLVSRIFPAKSRSKPRQIVLPVDIVYPSRTQNKSRPTIVEDSIVSKDNVKTGNESDYLKSKLWWSGFLLMNVGEMGTFLLIILYALFSLSTQREFPFICMGTSFCCRASRHCKPRFCCSGHVWINLP